MHDDGLRFNDAHQPLVRATYVYLFSENLSRRKQSGWHCDSYWHVRILLLCSKDFSNNDAISE
jgi:hypothetical protein